MAGSKAGTAKRSRTKNDASRTELATADYRHEGATRKNIPPASLAAEGKVPYAAKVRYHYSPHLPPVLRFDPTGAPDRLPDLIAEAGRRPLTAQEQKLLADALRTQEPWLEWAGKRESDSVSEGRGHFDVDPVALHIHERVSTQAILKVAARQDVQRDLFADPQQAYQEAVQFYRHDINWANRLILGDSLQVMSSLARRENLTGKVQMIYIDPPYGIKFASNFQAEVGKRDVKEKEQDLTREPEMVKAYRDTWRLGTHSYLTYLRERLIQAKALLADTGSIFVQISDENLHRVRLLMDEVFGPANFVSSISYRTMTPLESGYIESVYDYLLWYACDKDQMKYRNVFAPKALEGNSEFKFVEEDGFFRELDGAELQGVASWSRVHDVFKRSVLESSGFTTSCTFPFEFEGSVYSPRGGKSWRTNPAGMARLKAASRLFVLGTNPPAE